jgi:hypothetical protein
VPCRTARCARIMKSGIALLFFLSESLYRIDVVLAQDVVPFNEVPLILSASDCIVSQFMDILGTQIVDQSCSNSHPSGAFAPCLCSTAAHSSSIVSTLYLSASFSCSGTTDAALATSAFNQYCTLNEPTSIPTGSTSSPEESATLSSRTY